MITGYSSLKSAVDSILCVAVNGTEGKSVVTIIEKGHTSTNIASMPKTIMYLVRAESTDALRPDVLAKPRLPVALQNQVYPQQVGNSQPSRADS